MKKIYILIFPVLIVLCLCVFVFLLKEYKKMRVHAAYDSLYSALIIQLSCYYDDHDKYPKSLNELTDIQYIEGATPEMLGDFNYISSGDRCELSYFSEYYGHELKVYMIKEQIRWGENETGTDAPAD